jgi:putative chitinase
MLTLPLLLKAWPHGDLKIKGLLEGMANTYQQVSTKYKIPNNLVLAHIMAQGSHECDAGEAVVENLNYRASVLLKQWPTHFSPAQALNMQHHPEMIANQAYNGRMGNRIGTDDGWNFRGRGFTQVTGRDGYASLAKPTGLDLLNNPDLVLDPLHFFECGVADFINCGCLPYAESDNIYMVTEHLNGGQIGSSDRKMWLVIWKHLLGV